MTAPPPMPNSPARMPLTPPATITATASQIVSSKGTLGTFSVRPAAPHLVMIPVAQIVLGCGLAWQWRTVSLRGSWDPTQSLDRLIALRPTLGPDTAGPSARRPQPSLIRAGANVRPSRREARNAAAVLRAQSR